MSEIFDEKSVYQYLHTSDLHITVLPEVTSTNTVLAQKAQMGAPEGTVLAAHCQSSGRGRIGRSFASPKDGGLYFTLLLRPDFSPAQSSILTPTAAVAMAEAIESVCGIAPQIKWVNDLYLNERKICGILTETVPDKSGKAIDYVLIGIGVNIYPAWENLSPELAGKVGTIFPAKPDMDYRARLLAAFLDNFFEFYPALPQAKLYQAYKDRLFILNRKVTVIQGSETYQATVLDLNDDFSLRVCKENGADKVLFSGEISLQLL